MAQEMSPPPRPAPRPFSPYEQHPAHSPPGIVLPPAKRPRLSPGLGSPQSQMGAFPESPYAPSVAIAQSPMQSFNTPQPHPMSPQPGVMGPPPRPTPEQKAAKEREEKEKVTDISDISDAMWGSGVDLREEENYLSQTSRTFYGGSSQSFDTLSSSTTPNNSFNLLTQGLSDSNLGGGGPVSQSAVSQEAIEAEVEGKHQDAALKYAKEHERHLRDPFLLGNSVRHKMHKLALDQGVHLDVKGLYDPPKPQPPVPPQPQSVNGVVASGENDTAIAAIKAKSIPEVQHALLEENAKLADVLSLVSLATNERLRTLLDEAFAISRGRKYGSHGVVPPDLQAIASGEGRRSASIKPESITHSQWDLPRASAVAVAAAGPEPTVSFTSGLPAHLSSLAISEHAAEKLRIKRRAERAARLAAGPSTNGTASDTPEPNKATTSTPGTPAVPGAATVAPNDSPADTAAPTDASKPMTKKERERQAKAGQSDEVLHKNANSTAAMQLGFGRKFSWMTGGGGAGGGGGGAGGGKKSSNPFAKSGKGGSKLKREVGSGGGDASAPGADGAGDGVGGNRSGVSGAERKAANKGPEMRKFGVFREDGEQGRDIQLRDLAAVLERDGKHKRTLERAWLNLDREG